MLEFLKTGQALNHRVQVIGNDPVAPGIGMTAVNHNISKRIFPDLAAQLLPVFFLELGIQLAADNFLFRFREQSAQIQQGRLDFIRGLPVDLK